MKRIEARANRLDVPALRLYRPELEAVADLIQQASGRPVIFQSAGYEFDSIDEMATELGSMVRELKVAPKQDSWTGLSLNLTDMSNYIDSGGVEEGHGLKLREYLLKHRRVIALSYPARLVTGAALALIFAMTVGMVAVYFHHENVGLALTAGLLLFSWTKGDPNLVPGRSVIYLKRRHEHQSFWERHEENFIRGLIAVLSAAVGAVVTWGLKK